MKEELKKYISKIEQSDKSKIKATQDYLNIIAKPLHGLGKMEDFLAKLGGIDENLNVKNKLVVVACSDNGIVDEGVTQTDSSVTKIVAENITKGDATVCNMAKIANADVIAIDCGMNEDSELVEKRKVRYGTNNFALEQAMSMDDAEDTILLGIKYVKEMKERGYNLIAVGEMGIGNTTTSSAITASYLNKNAKDVTGKGAGLSDLGLRKKIQVIDDAINRYDLYNKDILTILSTVGGLDLAFMTGLFLGGAIYHIPMLVDGFISMVASMIAIEIASNSKDYIFSSHISKEHGAKVIADKFGYSPVIDGGFALGEGTGAVALMPIIDMAIEMYKNMPTFKGTKIEEYKNYD